MGVSPGKKNDAEEMVWECEVKIIIIIEWESELKKVISYEYHRNPCTSTENGQNIETSML